MGMYYLSVGLHSVTVRKCGVFIRLSHLSVQLSRFNDLLHSGHLFIKGKFFSEGSARQVAVRQPCLPVKTSVGFVFFYKRLQKHVEYYGESIVVLGYYTRGYGET
jgi:hypothetical protein